MTTTDYIPFVNTVSDCEIATKLYSDAVAFRISLESAAKTCSQLPSGPKRWLDPAIDGLHQKDISKFNDSYANHISRIAGFEQLANPAFQAAPKKTVVQQFVTQALNLCKDQKPDWVSVPQLPIVNDVSRNKINKVLAESAKVWKQESGFSGKFILPAIFTNQQQIKGKVERTKKLNTIMTCFNAAGADGMWMVDSSLNDQDGSSTFDKRFSKLRDLHDELNSMLPEDAITIGGPYWGMNIVLWARGLIRFAAVGLGTSYKYNIPGMAFSQSKTRVALGPLRRWSIASPKLRQWLLAAIQTLSAEDQNAVEFGNVEKEFAHFQAFKKNAKMQVATFYRQWFHKFSALPPAGRALALYHDLSSSYVLAKGLDDLPAEEGTARKPERVQQQLMMNCL
jgi:hypothetical protein